MRTLVHGEKHADVYQLLCHERARFEGIPWKVVTSFKNVQKTWGAERCQLVKDITKQDPVDSKVLILDGVVSKAFLARPEIKAALNGQGSSSEHVLVTTSRILPSNKVVPDAAKFNRFLVLPTPNVTRVMCCLAMLECEREPDLHELLRLMQECVSDSLIIQYVEVLPNGQMHIREISRAFYEPDPLPVTKGTPLQHQAQTPSQTVQHPPETKSPEATKSPSESPDATEDHKCDDDDDNDTELVKVGLVPVKNGEAHKNHMLKVLDQRLNNDVIKSIMTSNGLEVQPVGVELWFQPSPGKRDLFVLLMYNIVSDMKALGQIRKGTLII